MKSRSRRSSPLVVALLALVVAASASACSSKYLPGTEIEDKPETRAVFEVVMKYKRAMESRQSGKILALVSRNYYENNGTTDDRTDDYGYEKLKNVVLPELQQNVKAVQYRILLSRIEVDGDRGWASYEFYYTYKFVEGGKSGHDVLNNYNKLDFALEGGSWKIIGGL